MHGMPIPTRPPTTYETVLTQLGAEVTPASQFGTADAAAMAVTDGNSPARVQRRAGISVRVEDAPGNRRKPEVARGSPRV